MKIRNIDEGDKNKAIWRYMDFTKFLCLLENQSLYFPNIYSFEDALEGAHNALGRDDHYDINNNGEIVITGTPTDERHIENSQKYKDYLNSVLKEMADGFGILCWCISDVESHAMWKIFLSTAEGVAIKTDLDGIISSFPQGNFLAGKVEYIDRKITKISTENLLNSFFTKESHFIHENEFRIITYNLKRQGEGHFGNSNISKNDVGIDIPVNVSSLIKEIVVSPFAPKWFYHLVLQIKERYDLSVPVRWSEIRLR